MSDRTEQIRERLGKAIPGPWYWTDLGLQTRQELRATGRGVLRCSALMHPEPADAAFIANAPADVAFLLAEVERLEREKAQVWRDGYYTGKRDYAGSITSGASIRTPNPYEGVS